MVTLTLPDAALAGPTGAWQSGIGCNVGGVPSVVPPPGSVQSASLLIDSDANGLPDLYESFFSLEISSPAEAYRDLA